MSRNNLAVIDRSTNDDDIIDAVYHDIPSGSGSRGRTPGRGVSRARNNLSSHPSRLPARRTGSYTVSHTRTTTETDTYYDSRDGGSPVSNGGVIAFIALVVATFVGVLITGSLL